MPNEGEVYETRTCPACTRQHLVNPATGKSWDLMISRLRCPEIVFRHCDQSRRRGT